MAIFLLSHELVFLAGDLYYRKTPYLILNKTLRNRICLNKCAYKQVYTCQLITLYSNAKVSQFSLL